MSEKTSLSRRHILAAGIGGIALTSVLPRSAAALVPTPRQTPGPFYPVEIPLDHDNDLVQVDSEGRPAAGIPTHVFGRVLTLDGRPVAGARVEIWQCDAFGHYHHPRDRGGKADPAFQGYGRMEAGADGAYRFRTIKPVHYPGRTPHIHFGISGPGFERFTTQMYVEGEPDNARDGLLNRIRDEAARASVIIPLEPAPELEPDALTGTFNIVLGRAVIDG